MFNILPGYRHAVVLALLGGRQVLSCLDGEPLGALDGELASAYFKTNPFADPRTGYTNGTRADPASDSSCPSGDLANSSSSSGSSAEGSGDATTKKNTFDWSTVPMLPEHDAQERCPPELVMYQAHNALAAPSRPKSFVGRLREDGARGSSAHNVGGDDNDDDDDGLMLGVATPRGGSAAHVTTSLGSPERMRELTKKTVTSPFDAAGEELGDDEENYDVIEKENKATDRGSTDGGWTQNSSHQCSSSSRSGDPALKLELKGLHSQGSSSSRDGVPAPLTARSGFAQAIKAQLPSRGDDDANGRSSRPSSGGSNGGLLSNNSSSVDMSDPYALIRRLIAVVEDLKEEKAAAQAAWSEEGSSNHYYSSSSIVGSSGNGGGLGSSWPQRVAALEAEVEELRVQNANVFMLQEENKQLAQEAAEAQSLKAKCAELEKRNGELAADLEATSAQLQAVHLSQVVSAGSVPIAAGATPRGSASSLPATPRLSSTAVLSNNNSNNNNNSGSSLSLRPPLVGSDMGALRSSTESLRPSLPGSSCRPALPAMMPSLAFTAEPNLAPPLSSRPMTARPMTAAEVLDSVDDNMDAEVAALLAANEQSLKELQADVKQCKRDFKGKSSISGGSGGTYGVADAGATDDAHATATASADNHQTASSGGSRPSSSRRRSSATKTSSSQLIPPPLNLGAAVNPNAAAGAPLSSVRGTPPSITELLQMRSQGLQSSGPSSSRAAAAATPRSSAEPANFSQSVTASRPEIWSAADDNTSSDASDDGSEEDASPQTSPQQQQQQSRQHTQRGHFARPGAPQVNGEVFAPRPATSSSRLKNSGPAAAAAAASLGPRSHESNGVNKAALAAAGKSAPGDGKITVHSPRQAARVLDMLGLNE